MPPNNSNVLNDISNESTGSSQNANAGSVAKGKAPTSTPLTSTFITQLTTQLTTQFTAALKEGFASNAREMSVAFKNGFDVVAPALSANTKALNEGFASITPKFVAHTQALTSGFDGVVKVIEAQNDDARESGYIEFSVGAFCSIKKELAVALCVYIKSRAPAMEPTVKVLVRHLQTIRNAAGGSVTNKIAEAHPARAYNPAKGRFRDVLNCWQITTIPAVLAFASPAPAYAPAPASEPMEIDVVDSD
ncbi:hypothetical protein HDU88_008738 [Geranomyces variabilis]|nr:hypothetical protein HDU88_008738 [Geranomyces variabilis]